MSDKITRKEFIQSGTGVVIGAAVATHLPGCGESQEPAADEQSDEEQKPEGSKSTEKIFRGDTIITMDDDRREVEAVAISGGRILAAALRPL